MTSRAATCWDSKFPRRAGWLHVVACVTESSDVSLCLWPLTHSKLLVLNCGVAFPAGRELWHRGHHEPWLRQLAKHWLEKCSVTGPRLRKQELTIVGGAWTQSRNNTSRESTERSLCVLLVVQRQSGLCWGSDTGSNLSLWHTGLLSSQTFTPEVTELWRRQPVHTTHSSKSGPNKLSPFD